ncbi:MAG: ABC transporter ATP-binding protein [Clostridium sp.]|uniref:ABC transporter ATP-binding protein n=1 Tax=Clostridium sp. TaxID=1506 RepID=UPI003EE69D95
MSYIEVKNLSKSYGSEKVLKNINFTVSRGEIVSILGPSGSGKSTILEIFCGFKEADTGIIKIENKDILDKEPKDRNISMIFQNYALMPHLTVFDNIGLGMKIRGESKKIIKEKVLWAASILELEKYLDRKPKELSGGQRQRVAIGRGIVRKPKVFLMDEPLSNLDYKLRMDTANEIVSLNKRIDGTTIYITHDREEAMLISDRIIILKDGEIQQIGTPKEIYENPKNIFVAEFLGRPKINILDIEVKDNKAYFKEKVIKKIDLKNGNYKFCIRPEKIYIKENGSLKGIIRDIKYLGSEYIIDIEVEGEIFKIKTSKLANKLDESLDIDFNLDNINIFIEN